MFIEKLGRKYREFPYTPHSTQFSLFLTSSISVVHMLQLLLIGELN